MKKLTLIIAALIISGSAFADEKGKYDLDKAEFVAKQKIKSDEKGWKFNQDKVEATFDAMDADGNGIVTGIERKEYWAKNPKK